MDDFEWIIESERLNASDSFSYKETEYGDKISLSLAVFPERKEHPEKGKLTITLVNDSNYFISFMVLNVTDQQESEMTLKGIVEPNFTLDVARLSISNFSIAKFRLMALAYKKEKVFEPHPPIDLQFSLESSLLRKSSTYINKGTYFHEPHFEIPLIKDDDPVIDIHTETLILKNTFEGRRRQLRSFDVPSSSRIVSVEKVKKSKKNEISPYKILAPIEIDLHIDQLVDSTVGMDNFTMLTLQLDTIRKTMAEHSKRVGQKIIFIHGKGDGVLRKELRKLITREFSSCELQDASFQKYGFGATLVIIHQSPR